MRVILSSFLACSLTLGIAASAALALDKETAGQLANLEKKYFSHTFDNESDDARVERLEKLVFGDVTEGTPEQRIKNMAQATFDPLAPDPTRTISDLGSSTADQEETHAPLVAPRRRDGKTASKQTPRTTEQSPAAPMGAPRQASRNVEPVDPDDDTTKTQYPHITALEQTLLGKTYELEDLGARLSRLEMKAFGKTSQLSDYGDRTDDLDQYVVSKFHREPVPTRNPDDDGAGTVVPVTSDQGTYPRVTALEQAILGKAHAGDPLADRLSRMEAKAFGQSSSNVDLGARTDKLEKYAETKLHKKLHDERTETANSGSGGNKVAGMMEKQALAMAANLLLGAAGINRFGFSGIGMPSGLGPGMYNATNGGTMAGAIPMGGKHAHTAQQQQQPQKNAPTEEKEPENKKEDSVVLSHEAPPPTARLISKVGWCEMQTYGQTFTEMHLPERLVQLNRQYNVAPGKTGIDLMDRINDIVKAVDSRRAPLQSAAKKTSTATE